MNTNKEYSDITPIDAHSLAHQVQVGDIIFIHIDILPFRKIAHDTASWVNHVGIVIDVSGDEPVVAESTFPFSKTGPLSRFLRRSKQGRVAISRLTSPLNDDQCNAIKTAALKRKGVLYDTGFNLHSSGQFCSRFVHEVIKEGLGKSFGRVENLDGLFRNNPQANLFFWRIWYFGKIPWKRETVTPASLLEDAKLYSVFNGYVDGSTL